jgi:hypothetical protein
MLTAHPAIIFNLFAMLVVVESVVLVVRAREALAL